MWHVAIKGSLITMLFQDNQRRKNKTARTWHNLNNDSHFILGRALASDIWKTVSNSGAILRECWQSLIKLQQLLLPLSLCLETIKSGSRLLPVLACASTCVHMCVYNQTPLDFNECWCLFAHWVSIRRRDRDIIWKRHIFHPAPFALRRGLPVTLNLCWDVCMWAYQPSAEPEILIPSPPEPASPHG